MKIIDELKNIAVIRTDRIGEVLLSTTAIDAIKKCSPGTCISFVTSRDAAPLVERDDVENVIIVGTFKKKRIFLDAVDLALELKKHKFDAAIVLNAHKTLHLACFMAGIPYRIGYDRKWGFLLNVKTDDERDKGEKHEIEYTMDLLRLTGADCVACAPRLSVNDEDKNSIQDLMRENDLSASEPLITVHPGSSNPVKRWPAENYAALIRKMKKELNCNIAIVGGPDEKNLAGDISKTVGTDVLNLVGKLKLKELAAFLKKSAIFIGNDAGPMHMAVAVDVPVIAIFGRNIKGVGPVRWGPWGSKHVVFHEDPGCAPCYDTTCPYDHKCLRAITVDAVFNAVAEKLRSAHSA